MKYLWLPFLACMATVSVATSATDTGYFRHQLLSPEILRIDVQDVQQKENGGFLSSSSATVLIKARVQEVLRTESNLTPGREITIRYIHKFEAGGYTQSPIPPKKGTQVYAFLKGNGSEYIPAAHHLTFESPSSAEIKQIESHLKDERNEGRMVRVDAPGVRADVTLPDKAPAPVEAPAPAPTPMPAKPEPQPALRATPVQPEEEASAPAPTSLSPPLVPKPTPTPAPMRAPIIPTATPPTATPAPSPTPAASSSTEGAAAIIYTDIYGLIKKGDDASFAGNKKDALACYASARSKLVDLKAQYPDFQAFMVNYRLQDLDQKIARLQQ